MRELQERGDAVDGNVAACTDRESANIRDVADNSSGQRTDRSTSSSGCGRCTIWGNSGISVSTVRSSNVH